VGEDAKAPGVQGLTISGNLMCHAGGGGAAVVQNPGTRVTGVAVVGNRLRGFAKPDEMPAGGRREGNVVGLAACS
jgi:hypothetical protein